jgi:hypothetical protein
MKSNEIKRTGPIEVPVVLSDGTVVEPTISKLPHDDSCMCGHRKSLHYGMGLCSSPCCACREYMKEIPWKFK